MKKKQPSFSDTLSKLLSDNNETKVSLALHLGLSPQTITNYCNGSCEPTLNTLVKIADHFGVTTDYILGRKIGVENPISACEAAASLTGLSVKAIGNIRKVSYDPEIVDLLNAFLESDFTGAQMKKPVVHFKSRGSSGNIYFILGLVSRALSKARRPTDYNTCRDRVFASCSYDEALSIIREYVDLIDDDLEL